jgi:hypothetical protein
LETKSDDGMKFKPNITILKDIHNSISQRYIWLFAAVSALSALLVMLLWYVQWCPLSDVGIKFEPWETANLASKGTEFRINYIMADDKYLPLKEFAGNGWKYDGTLYTAEKNILALSVKANRIVEVSLKRGPWMTRGSVTVGAEYEQYDFYSETDHTQQFKRVMIHHFLRPISMALGAIVFALCFIALYKLFWKQVPEFMRVSITFADIVVSALIFGAVGLLLTRTHIFPYRKAGLTRWDVGQYVAIAKFLANGFTPYRDIVTEKGPVLFLLIALGEKLWYPHGVYFVESLMILAGYAFLYLALRQHFSKRVSVVGILFAVAFHACVYQDGTSTESFSHIFNCIGFYVFVRLFANDCQIKKRWLIICGACFAAVMMIRQNNAFLWLPGVLILAVTQLTHKRIKEMMLQILLMFAGFCTVFVPVLIWLGIFGVLRDWFMQTYLYLFEYIKFSGKTPFGKVKNALEMIINTDIKHIIFVPIIVIVHQLTLKIKKRGGGYNVCCI